RLGLRRERKIAPELGDEERPYAEAVASKEQLSSLPVPDGDREVPVEALQASRAPLLVRVGDHLGVARRRESVAEAPQFRLQLDVVVDLAVLHDPVPAVLVGERLIPVDEVDDGESSRRHSETPVQVETGPVRSTVLQLPGNGEQKLRVSRTIRTRIRA